MGVGSSSVETRQFIKRLVRQNCVVIFSTTTCPYCRIAKEMFTRLNVSVKVVELNEMREGQYILRELRTITQLTTVPQVFINGVCIGGGVETKQLFESGLLKQLTDECQSFR